MADLICRWRNATPKTVVELVNSMPHTKMTHAQFRKSMEDKWDGGFFRSSYQLACQLGLYCESEDGFYYPRFDHDITIDEAKDYLDFWAVRYYVPNPYVGKDGFKDIPCPTYVIKALYDYVKNHPGCDYEQAYRDVFHDTAKNNDDIIRNFINNYSKVLTFSKDGSLSTTKTNPQQIFGFMNRNDKKAFFDNFKKETPISLMTVYLEADLAKRQEMFKQYLVDQGKATSSINQYVNNLKNNAEISGIVNSVTGEKSIFMVTDLLQIKKIYNLVNALDSNKSNNNVYSASVSNYQKFIDYLDEAYQESDGENPTVEQPDEPEDDSKNAPFSISAAIEAIDSTGLLYSPNLIKRFVFSLMTKPFVILSGLAGSGKTQLAVAFAKAMSRDESQYRIVSVGADWTNREPLLGFPNALNKDEYVSPENGVLQLLIDANKVGNENKPYFLILDEMNLSYVERYFADFLSVMESHGNIPLWEKPDESESKIPVSVNLPKNLFIIGTINVDETTYMFSPKVLDRANVIEFKISSDEMQQFLANVGSVNVEGVKGKISSMGQSFVALASQKDLADDGEAKSKLLDFFKELKYVNAEFGYRSATEIFRFISQAKNNDDSTNKLTDDEILDAAIVQKLLPKLHGSRKKLEPVLKALWRLCMPDTYKGPGIDLTKIDEAVYKESADKIARMYNAAQDNGFTSFAEA